MYVLKVNSNFVETAVFGLVKSSNRQKPNALTGWGYAHLVRAILPFLMNRPAQGGRRVHLANASY